MALIPIGLWQRDSTYRVHPLGLMDSTYRVPLLDSKLVRLCYAWYYRIKSPSGPSSVLAALRTPKPSFWALNEVEPCMTYPNLYLEHSLSFLRNLIGQFRGTKSLSCPQLRSPQLSCSLLNSPLLLCLLLSSKLV